MSGREAVRRAGTAGLLLLASIPCFGTRPPPAACTPRSNAMANCLQTDATLMLTPLPDLTSLPGLPLPLPRSPS